MKFDTKKFIVGIDRVEFVTWGPFLCGYHKHYLDFYCIYAEYLR
jgi:hypothetical protein